LALAIVASLAGLGLLTEAMQNSGAFGRWRDLILLVNVIGALVLAGVLLVNVTRLLRDRRRRTPGAALKLRLMLAFAAIAAVPMLLLFLVAVQFLHRGIETWVDDEIGRELERSLRLSQANLDAELERALGRTREAANRLARLPVERMSEALPALRSATGAEEMSVFASDYRAVATAGARDDLPVPPSEDMLEQLPRDGSYAAIEPGATDRLRMRTAVLIRVGAPGEGLLLQAIYPVEGPLGDLAASVQRVYTRYGEGEFLREPLETGFTVALAMVLLLALFTALYGALLFARGLVAPLRRLVAGTRAVAAGQLDLRLPVTSGDDIGALVQSFNEMTARLDAARDEAQRNAEQIDRARASLAIVLARLTSGVIAVDEARCLRIVNDAAGEILQAGLKDAAGRGLDDLARAHPHLAAFFAACEERSRASPEGWREQLTLPTEAGARRVLMCSAAPLPPEFGAGPGYVLVFEDITDMLKAQREAAWGEVARRLAHEIKNPLTPIQLSAERIRRRYLASLPAGETELLDRATHTIVQQVEALRDMVNAFGEYARSPEISFAPLELNRLVRAVADLYHGPQQPEMRLQLDETIGTMEADGGRLRQLLHNLIRNACEALEGATAPRVVIETRAFDKGDARYAEILVQDNGPGIDTELLETMFEPYVTGKTRGTGLGLAIARRLVEEHGGSITAENIAGGGARIKVILPVSQAGRDSQPDPRVRRAGERR
jgi:nitrogen fixation/metabolism regulation signal transduction histidine kinase